MKKYFLLIPFILGSFLSEAQQNDNAEILKIANLGELIPFTKNDTIPISIYNDEIILKVSVNGIKHDYLWDNGFSFSVIDTSISKESKLINYEEQGSYTATDAVNKKIDLDIKIASKVTIGNIKINNSPFIILELKNLLEYNTTIKGIVGATIIKKLNWKFDFDKNYVVVSQKPFEDKGKVIPFRLDPYNMMFTNLEINGINGGEVLIDFGLNSDDIILTYDVIGMFEKTKKLRTHGITTSGVTGFEDPDISYTIKDFDYKIGGVVLDHPIKLVLSKVESGATIGNRMLRHYNCIINSDTKEIILSTRKVPIEPRPEKSFGFLILKIDKELTITATNNNPNVIENKGLKFGDKLLNINGKKASDFEGNESLGKYLIALLLDNKDLKVTTKEGEIYSLTPKYNIYE